MAEYTEDAQKIIHSFWQGFAVGAVCSAGAVCSDKQIPTLASAQTWYKSTTPLASISAINIVDTYTPNGSETERWAADSDGVGQIMCYLNGSKLTIAGNGTGRIKANPDSSYAFANFTNMATLTGLDVLDTSAVTNMTFMFGWSNLLVSLDLSGFDTSSVTDLSSMFIEADSLTEIDLSSFDTSHVTTMHGMLNGCGLLQIVNLSSFDTGAVTDMQYMFNYCQNIKYIFVGDGWDTSGANTANMFNVCGVSAVVLPVADVPPDMTQWTKNDPALTAYQSIVYDAAEDKNTCLYSGVAYHEAILVALAVKAGKTYVFSMDYYCATALEGNYAEPYCPYLAFMPGDRLTECGDEYANALSVTLLPVAAMTDFQTYRCSYTATADGTVGIALWTGSVTDGVQFEFQVKNARLSISE